MWWVSYDELGGGGGQLLLTGAVGGIVVTGMCGGDSPHDCEPGSTKWA